MEALIGVLKKIFVYHKIEFKKEIKAQWVNDLKPFTPNEIETAWNIWRKSAFNTHRQPVSFELIKIIRENKNFYDKKEIKEKPSLRLGESTVQDSLIKHLDIMHKNMPDLLDRLKEINSPIEKLVLCCLALDRPELTNSSIVHALVKKLNRVENVI